MARDYSGWRGVSSFHGEPYGREGQTRRSVPFRAFPDHRAPVPRRQQRQPCPVPRRGALPETCGGTANYHSNSSSPPDISYRYLPQYTPPRKCLEGDGQHLAPSRSSHPYTQEAHRENLRGRSAHLLGRECNKADHGRECTQEVPEGEYSKPHQDIPKAVKWPSPLATNLADVSCSTTRSSSGSRCESRRNWHAQVQSNSTVFGSSGDPVFLTAAGGVGPEVQQKETEGGRGSLTEDATAAAAAGADIPGMTEDEVRAYALQLQALTQVLLRNMRCLYSTARAEIDRKNQRIAAQEREIDSLKSLQARPDNGS